MNKKTTLKDLYNQIVDMGNAEFSKPHYIHLQVYNPLITVTCPACGKINDTAELAHFDTNRCIPCMNKWGKNGFKDED